MPRPNSIPLKSLTQGMMRHSAGDASGNLDQMPPTTEAAPGMNILRRGSAPAAFFSVGPMDAGVHIQSSTGAQFSGPARAPSPTVVLLAESTHSLNSTLAESISTGSTKDEAHGVDERSIGSPDGVPSEINLSDYSTRSPTNGYGSIEAELIEETEAVDVEKHVLEVTVSKADGAINVKDNTPRNKDGSTLELTPDGKRIISIEPASDSEDEHETMPLNEGDAKIMEDPMTEEMMPSNDGPSSTKEENCSIMPVQRLNASTRLQRMPSRIERITVTKSEGVSISSTKRREVAQKKQQEKGPMSSPVPSMSSKKNVSFPLSPSMTQPRVTPFTSCPKFSRKMRREIREWVFMSKIRKKKLPLNKYGLPDVSADELEKELPEKRVIDQMRKAFRDLTESRLISGWDDGSGFEYVIDLFSQLLDLICSFVGRRQTEKFRKALDIDVLKQMVHAHVYTPSEFQETLKICVGLLYELESPYQHMLTKKWWESLKYDYATKEEYATAICDSIMHLFRKCDLCKMEVENYYISRISPADRQKQELQAFQKIPLPLSTPWDCTSRENFVAGLVKTVANNPKPLQESEVTSCLALDLTQLHTFQNSLQAVTLFGVISIVLNKILMKIDQESLKEFFDNFTEAYEINAGTTDILFEHLKKYISIDEHSAAKEGCAQIVKCADMSDPLYKVLSDRVVKFLVDETTENKTPLGATPEHLCHANDRALNLKQVTATFIEDHWKVYETVYVPTAKMRIKDDI